MISTILAVSGEGGAEVFSRLGDISEKQSEGKIIGVLGCVAQQEGDASSGALRG